MKERIMITGSSGKIGRRLVGVMEGMGHEVVLFDIAHSPEEDILDPDEIDRKITNCEVVIHLAAIPHPDPRRSFREYFNVNVVGTMNVMESAVQKGLKRFVYASSIGYYGVNVEGRLMPEYLPIDEKIRIAAIDGACDGKLNSYNQSKVMAEQICAYYGTNRMIETIVLRLAPANDLEDQYREGEDIPYGNYQEKCFWANVDLINVEQAFVKAVKYSGAGFYDVFNIGNRRIYGRIPVRHWLEDKYPGVPTFCSNHESLYSIEKARSKLGYEPTR